MSLQWFMRNNAGDIVELVNGVRAKEWELVSHAEELSVGGGSITVDDAALAVSIRGHRVIWAEIDGEVIWAGYTNRREIDRGRAPLAREWKWSVDDADTILDRRILLGTDCDRPAETDVARMTWLLATTEASNITDTTLVSSANPEAMDACDYRKVKVSDVINDCMQQSGKNAYAYWIDGAVPTFGLWYGHDSVDAWESEIRISNILTDVDHETTLEAAYASRIERDPTRVYSKVIVDCDGFYVPVERPETAERFAARDCTMAAPFVKTKAKAIARGLRYLQDIRSEVDRISTAIVVRGDQVNLVREGHKIEARFSHLSGLDDDVDFSDWTWFRVQKRTIRQLGPRKYEVALELSAIDDDATAGPGGSTAGNAYGILYMPHGPYGQKLVYWDGTGDDPPPGKPTRPTTANLSVLLDDSPPNVNWPWYGFQVNADGTIDVRFEATVTGVRERAKGYVITWAILKNGGIVATETHIQDPDATGLAAWGDRGKVTIAGLSVADGDLITAQIDITPKMAFWRTPQGVGSGGEGLEITGGLLA